MTEQNTDNITILFADVAGSTQLYEKVGDAVAQKTIAQVLSFMSDICTEHQGTLVKHIGDEILCRFDDSLAAALACSKIQAEMKNNEEMADLGLQVRMGMNTGPVILADNDVFGDTVNVAARMASLARARQIICTGETIADIGPNAGVIYRQLDSLIVKGKAGPVDVYEILWSPDDTELTAFFSAREILEQTGEWKVNLDCQGHTFQINKAHPVIVIGRSQDCDFIVPSPHASRKHAQLISRWGKLVLKDQSTNGTYVKLENGSEFFVHMEEVPLSENGGISLGVPSAQNPDQVIWYTYENKS